jgi:hypothetical protein
VVIDHRDQKHQPNADQQEADLLMVEAVELGMQRRRFDLDHADQRQQKHQRKQGPVEVAEGRETAHGGSAIAGLR